MTDKVILDVTCGSRGIWFNKNHPRAIYCDKRSGKYQKQFGKGHGGLKTLNIDPDVICDFTDLPFENNTFALVVFDPPHMKNLSEMSWIRAAYGVLEDGWQSMIRDGFNECMRILKPDGILIFKWSEVQFPTTDILNAIGQRPLFGHHSGKKMNTNWLCFMKE